MKRSLLTPGYTLLLLILTTTLAYAQPTYTSVPTNAATGISKSANIVLTFSQAVRAIPGPTTLTDANVDDYIHLRLTNTSGADIDFDATINGAKTVITIDPDEDLPSGAVIFVEPITLEAVAGGADMVPASFTFTVVAYPVATFNPTNGSTGHALNAPITITYSEVVREIDNSSLSDSDLEGLIELKLTDNSGADVDFSVSIDGTNTIITILPDENLLSNQLYYLEIDPIEDVSDNATSQQSITFTTLTDVSSPVPTFLPAAGATGVVETSNITITFDEAIRKIDNTAITPSDLATLIELKFTGDGGAAVGFTANIDLTNKVITIDPTPTLNQNTIYYVEINPIEDIYNNAITATNITFTTGNTLPPTVTFNPLNVATGVALGVNPTITFNEAIRNIDDSPITPATLATTLEFKLTDNSGMTVPFTASIDGTNTIITIVPSSALTSATQYYLEINPVEDFGNNAITANNITFTTIDVTPPVPTFTPLNGATNVPEVDNITIAFNEPIRKIDNTPITVGDLATLVELKLNNNGGAPVAFTPSIAGNTITINPDATLTSNQLYYVEINPIEDASNNAITATSITFTTGDFQPPTLAFSPTAGSINFGAQGSITITFTEPIRKTDNTAITVADLATLVELKTNSDGGTPVAFTPSINGGNTIITINPDATLLHNQLYYVEMNVVEDAANNAITAQSITFTTEDRPSITNFTPGVNERCIGDNVTVNGLRFTGTGNPNTGNSQPTVYVNAVPVPVGNIVSFTSTQVVFTLPSMTPGNYPITIRNNNSDLLSAGTNFDVRPAIITNLPVIPATLSPAQNTNVDIQVGNGANPTQDGNYTYSLIITSAPAGYSITPPLSVHSLTGNNGIRTLNTSEGSDPDLTLVGDYTYRIDVSRTNCTTRTLTNTPFTLNVASLQVNVSATDVTVCAGTTTTLIGSASGGTGFYQFRWSSTPAGFTSSASSPTVTPPGNIRYTLEVEDNAGNVVTDFVDITSVPLPVATIDPIPGETTVRTNYTIEDRFYRLYGSPAGGVFSGPGVALIGSFYYFNPSNAGVGDSQIFYTFTDGAGCTGQDMEEFSVSAASVNGLDLSYCKNVMMDPDELSPVNGIVPGGWQFTRLVFYASGCTAEPVPAYFSNCGRPNPLTVVTSVPDVDIDTGLPILRPTEYSLDLDIIRTHYGYSTSNSFYILVYAKDASGYEDYWQAQYFRVLDNDPAPTIVGINEGQNVCSDRTPITLSSSEPGYNVSSFTISSYSGTLSSGVFNPNHASITGAGIDEENLRIRMNYSDFNNCPSSVDRNFTWVKKPPLINVTDTAFCQFGNPASFKIEAKTNRSADRAYWYDENPVPGPSVVLDSVNFIFKVPGIDGQNDLVEDFFVRQSYKGCKGDVRQVNFTINPAPDATITRSAICEDRTFNLSGPEESNNTPYANYLWTFGDGQTRSINNDSTTTYRYPLGTQLSNFLIKLEITTGEGCTAFDIDNITVNPNPIPVLTYNFVCEGDKTKFIASTTNIPAAEFAWNFDDGTIINRGVASNAAPEGGTIREPEHRFIGTPGQSAGDYEVILTAWTANGCTDTVTNVITILDTLVRKTIDPYVMNSALDGGRGYWRLQDVEGNSTWQFAIPVTPVMNEFSSPAWVTNPSGLYAPNEYSFLNSPCLNIQNIDRPVISLDYVLNTDVGKDGVVIEYSKDRGVTWQSIGNVNSGFNWFNTNGFSIGNIGNSSIGWSGNSWELPTNIAGDTLVQGRRALDNIPGLTNPTDRSNLRFRIAFRTNGDGELNGFAFNNMTIGSRNRVLLAENFTNQSASAYSDNNIDFKLIPVGEVVKIQYHVGAPGEDPNYDLNTADPSARAAYYGIPLNNITIPRAYIDGRSQGNFTEDWIDTERDQRSLKVSPYNITIRSHSPANAAELEVSVRVRKLENNPAGTSPRPVLHVAVVQKTAGSDTYVLRKMVPSAVGRLLPADMEEDDEFLVTDNIRLEKEGINFNELAVVAFIQDELTREVYQAQLNDTLAFLPDPDLITGTEDDEFAKRISIYPNPANHQLNIALPTAVSKPLPVTLTDAYGRTVHQAVFNTGEKTKTISTSELADGIYMMQIITPQGNKAVRKVMVKH